MERHLEEPVDLRLLYTRRPQDLEDKLGHYLNEGAHALVSAIRHEEPEPMLERIIDDTAEAERTKLYNTKFHSDEHTLYEGLTANEMADYLNSNKGGGYLAEKEFLLRKQQEIQVEEGHEGDKDKEKK